ncbi:hypothetical protein [Robertkochia solimangrovi]|uniref:hypothetical protein n=1 Tax=Robertkochia solimangrovi TaxID=2213046 RepID=UPI00117EF1C2|nr:hypothetical protein [Robertkochia solimangrovi]
MRKLRILFITLLIASCGNGSLLNDEEKEYLLQVTESEDLILTHNNGDFTLELYNSEITDEGEQELFSSIILLQLTKIVDKKLNVKDTYGNNTVIFKDKKGERSYDLNNMTLSDAMKSYNSLDSIITYAEVGDKLNLNNFIVGDLLTKSAADQLVNKCLDSFNSEVDYVINSYGFENSNEDIDGRNREVIKIYTIYENSNVRKHIIFTFISNFLWDAYFFD